MMKLKDIKPKWKINKGYWWLFQTLTGNTYFALKKKKTGQLYLFAFIINN
jgi:hypothetical protein